MIFRTINADAKKLTEQFGLLNKSFRDIKKDFANGLGVKNSLFQTSISKTDYQALQKFNTAIQATNDGLTKSQRITKAWNENMTGCSVAAKRMGNDLVTGKKNIQDVSKAMNTASVSTKALGVAMNVMANVGFMLVITAITKVISELAQAQENAIQAAKEATETYKGELDSISDYKKRLSELHEELKSGNLSYEQTKTKRTELMSIQDELIEKFGNEKGAIESVTEAINGQVDALDELNEKAYRDWVAKADEQKIWNKLLPWGKSGLDQAIDYMETEKTVSFMDMQNANLSDELQAIQKEIDETIQAKYNLDKTFAMFNVTGTPDEIKSQLEAIRQDYIDISEDVFNNHGITDRKLWEEYRKETIDSINEIQNKFNEGLEKHQQTYQTYIEGLIKYDSEYSDEYANILQKRAELESAQLSGNKEDIKKAKQEFMDAINDGVTASVSDEPIKKYFESLYPELQAEFSKWAFEFDLEANVKGLDDTVKEIGEKYTSTDLLGMINDESAVIADSAFNSLIDKAIEYGICTDKSAEEVQKLIDLLVELGIVQDNVKGDTLNNDDPISFSIGTYEEQIDNIQSSISTLRSALDSFNKGTLDESEVLDLMQKFPELIPYIDLAADGFGNLSEGLSRLIAQQPDSLIQSLQTLKESLNTDEERAQVDALIDSLQALSSYGDTGIEAYATSIGSTWTDTANVIESVTTQFENLAKVQEAVANGLTISTSAAAELAKIYPEILTNATYAGNEQIQLNEEVVKSILAGDQSIINAQITKLEADKALLEGKKSYSEAQLEMAKQVAEGEGNITKEVAQYRLDIANSLLEALIEAGMEEDKAYAAVAANMAGNMEEYSRIVGEVAQNTSSNMDRAAVSMANSININAINAQNSFKAMQQSVWNLADSIKAAANGERSGNAISPSGGGSSSVGTIKADRYDGRFTQAKNTYESKAVNFKDFQSQLEIDIKGYEQAISNIDSQIEVLKNLQATFADTVNSANGGIGGHNYADKIKDLEKEKDKINKSLDNAKSGSGSSKETKDEYEELFDFFERRLKVLDNVLSLLKTNLDNVTGSFAKNKLIDAELGVTEEKFKNYSDALNMYTQKANEALSKLPSDIAAKIKDGAVDLTTFIGDGNKEVVEAIKDYEQWADKVADCKQELAELRTAIRQLELEKFNNIMEEFSNQFDLRKDGKDLISKQIDLLKEAGQLIGESFFTTQIDQSKKQLALLEEEKTKLVEQMTSAVSSGRVQKGTDEWLEMANTLSDVEGNILDCKKAIEEFDNELLQLHWDIFDRIQGQFKDLDSELSNLRGLFDDLKVTDGNFNWSKEGIAQLGLLTQQYELTQYQVQKYNDAIADLEDAYSAGKYSATEYVDKLSELSKEQWDAVNSSESIKDAIIELNEVRIDEEIDAIEKEISAYKELIDAQIDALKAAKDLHDYQQSIAEKTKSITDLERQIAAMQNDDTAATIAKRKQLEEQLSKARKDLEDAEYDHSIEAQEDALNKQYEDYKKARDKEIEALKASLEERETLIAQSFETVKLNADLVGQEIATIATQHGITVSDAIITSWQNGETAIASYGDVLSAGTSAFIGNIMGVENEVYALQAQANSTADSLAWMFSTRADNLVNELTSSYYSEENLNYMTQALHDSLINTLEGGYNISSITSALNSITSGLNGVASAANNAASAMAAVGAAQSGIGNSGFRSSSSSTNNYSLVDMNTGRVVESGLSKEAAEEKQRKITGRMYEVKCMAKGGIVTKDDNNPLNHIAQAVGEDTLIAAKEGEGVLTKEETDRVKQFIEAVSSNSIFAKIKEPDDIAQFIKANPVIWDPPQYISNAVKMSEMIPNNVNRNNNIDVHYDSLVNIQGDVHDANRIVKQIESVTEKAIKKSWHDFDMTRKYGY